MGHFFVPRDDNFQLLDGKWNGYTLILPCVSVGNVPQLTTDLLINSLVKTNSDTSKNDLELVGYIRSANVHPFAGPDPFTLHGSLFATSIQVFMSQSKKLIIIQQRSPIYQEFRNDFYSELSQWISKHSFSLILLLSSSFDHYLVRNLNEQTLFPMSHLSVNLKDHLKLFLEQKLDLKPVKPVDPYTLKPDPSGRIRLPGSGSARAYVKTFDHSFKQQQNEVPIVCLVMHCSEGDNRVHAFKFADKVAALVNQAETVFKQITSRKPNEQSELKETGAIEEQPQFEWTPPFSWRTMFGDEPPSEIF